MKTSEFRKLIREEVKMVLKEQTLKEFTTISKGAINLHTDIKVGDYIHFPYRDKDPHYVAKVVKNIGTAHYQGEGIAPTDIVGDLMQFTRKNNSMGRNTKERFPRVGERVVADREKAGSFDPSRGGMDAPTKIGEISGIVTKVDYPNRLVYLKGEDGKVAKYEIGKAYGKSELPNMKVFAG